jgi:Arc/MetJ family transcription regulator
MRSTIDIDDELLKEAMKVTKARTKRELIHLSLKEIIRQKRLERLLSRLGNCDLDLTQERLEEMRRDD